MLKKKLPMRSGVGVIILNNENKVFVGKRKDNPVDQWQMPQGGVDIGEDYISAMKRELYEETGIKNIQLLREINGLYEYELPKKLIGIIWKGKFRGQRQKWFIVKFIGDDEEINIKTKYPEFLDWKWEELSKITDTVVEFKLHVYQEIQKEVEKVIN